MCPFLWVHYPPLQTLTRLIAVLDELASWVDEIKPIAQPMRYGNKAFRAWHARLVKEGERLCKSLLPSGESAAAEGSVLPSVAAGGAGDAASSAAAAGGADGPVGTAASAAARCAGAEVELLAYLLDSFGNATRIDYGTGHESTFMILVCECTCSCVATPPFRHRRIWAPLACLCLGLQWLLRLLSTRLLAEQLLRAFTSVESCSLHNLAPRCCRPTLSGRPAPSDSTALLSAPCRFAPADCLAKLGVVGPSDLLAVGTKVFPRYMSLVRKLQRTYWLGAFLPSLSPLLLQRRRNFNQGCKAAVLRVAACVCSCGITHLPAHQL